MINNEIVKIVVDNRIKTSTYKYKIYRGGEEGER